jgi:hypothetical protein
MAVLGPPWSTAVNGMSDIFISYASADRARAKLLAETLVRRGWLVWWDRTIPPGQEYDKVIENALDSAKCVVVLWSSASVASSWVKTEAAEAMRRTILVPALLDPVTIPLEFRRLQAADLSHWRGETSHPELEKFIDSIRVKIQGMGGTEPPAKLLERPPDPPPPPIPPGGWKRAVWPAIALIGVLVGVASGLMFSRSQQADQPRPADPVSERAPVPQPPAPQPRPTPDPVINPGVVDPPAPAIRPPAAQKPNVVKQPEPAPAPVAVEPVTRPVPPPSSAVRPPLPEPPTAPLGATDLPTVAAAAPKLPVQEFEEILLVVNNQGEIEELDATLEFGDTSLVLKDEDAKILRTLPYSSVGKATYSRTQRRIMFVRTVRHQLTLGSGRDEVVLRLPDATYQSIIYQIEKRTGVKVAP